VCFCVCVPKSSTILRLNTGAVSSVRVPAFAMPAAYNNSRKLAVVAKGAVSYSSRRMFSLMLTKILVQNPLLCFHRASVFVRRLPKGML
jgi:hypothetical protein